MLTTLRVENFVFIEQLSLSFSKGMTALTGETGAGKSILCDALWLALGAPTDKTVIQHNKSFCLIEACFSITHLPWMQQWLTHQGYGDNTQPLATCTIKRRIPVKGNHQIWINQKPSNIKAVKWLRDYLVIRHNQQDHQRLTYNDYQLTCLDRYGQYGDLLTSVDTHYQHYTLLKKEEQRLLDLVGLKKNEVDLLHYQLEELSQMQLQPNEVDQLDEQQRQLSCAHQVLEKGQAALFMIREAEPLNVLGALQQVHQLLQMIIKMDARFNPIESAIEKISVDLVEMESALHNRLNQVVCDPSRLAQINERLEQIYQLARKHKVNVEELPQLEERLKREYTAYENSQHDLIKCRKDLKEALQQYQDIAAQLTDRRRKAALALQTAMTEKIQTLGMPGGQFKIQADTQLLTPRSLGNERITFYLSAAPGQSLQPLSKGASGGELSRLSLVIQQLIVQKVAIATVIFDEVDVGVGGSVAERMGHVLSELSQKRQVLCITHLPQVASLAKHHYVIKKQTNHLHTITQMLSLENFSDRVAEIARMLGGINVTNQTIAHATAMLVSGQQYERN